MAWAERRGRSSLIRDTVNGRRVAIATVPRELEKAFLDRYRREKELKRLGLPNLDKTLEALKDEYLAGLSLAENTKDIYRRAIEAFLNDTQIKNVGQLSAQEIEGWKRQLLARHRASTASINLRALKVWLSWCVKMGAISTNPASQVRIPKALDVARFLTTKEVKRLLTDCGPELKRIVVFALHTGMRRGEIIAARYEDICRGFLAVARTKTGRSRSVPLHEKALAAVSRTPGPLFPGWDIWRLERAFRRAVRRSGLGVVRFHDLRHTFCSTYLARGGTIADLREITGHQSLASLQVYAHFQRDELKRRIERLRY